MQNVNYMVLGCEILLWKLVWLGEVVRVMFGSLKGYLKLWCAGKVYGIYTIYTHITTLFCI